MTATVVKAKQKLTSNFDQSISESIDDVLTRDTFTYRSPKTGKIHRLWPGAGQSSPWGRRPRR
jgi:hypothetical protein